MFKQPEPEPPSEFWGKDYLRLAQTLHERGDYKRALAKAVRAIESLPTNPLPYVVAGDALAMLDEDDIDRITELSRDESTPEGFYESALLHEPENELRVEILRKLAVSAEEHSDYARAADRAEEMRFYADDDSPLYYVALYRSLDTGDLQTDALQRALSLDPAAHALAATDERWWPWREQVDELIAEAKHLMVVRADDAYRRATEAIDRAEAMHFAVRTHRG